MYTPLCLLLLCYTIFFTHLNSIAARSAANTAIQVSEQVVQLKERTAMLGLGVVAGMFTGRVCPVYQNTQSFVPLPVPPVIKSAVQLLQHINRYSE